MRRSGLKKTLEGHRETRKQVNDIREPATVLSVTRLKTNTKKYLNIIFEVSSLAGPKGISP